MAKVKKYQLVFEQEFDFDMLGISSHHNDYRLAWSLNAELGFHFELAEPYVNSQLKKGATIHTAHPMFEYHDTENGVSYFLIKNKEAGKYLIPEKPSVDFFLFVYEREMIDLEAFGRRVRNVSSVIAIFHFEPEDIPSAQSLVF